MIAFALLAVLAQAQPGSPVALAPEVAQPGPAQTPVSDGPTSGGAVPATAPRAPIPAAHRPSPSAWVNLSLEERVKVLEAAAREPLHRRLLAHSARFLNTPYALSPLGEGAGPDADPLVRYDAVDCLTFVEETIALTLARSEDEVLPALDRIRYAEGRSYQTRNHLMEAQWLPNNLRKGFVREVTRRFGGADVQRVNKVITAQSWTSPSSQSLALPKDRQLVGEFGLDVIPLEKVREHVAKVPSGTIALIVREDRPFKVTRVTHLGFIVQKKNRTFLRHAARSVFARVVDEDLESFLTRNGRYDKWKVVGLSFLEVRDPGPLPVAKAE